METKDKTAITIETTINASIEKVWEMWTNPKHIVKWNSASDDWHTTKSENDLRKGGKFSARMEAKDGSAGFDFSGVYEEVKKNELIISILDDQRKVKVTFSGKGNEIKVVETFDAENVNPIEMQRAGWQAILNNFKKYVEHSAKEKLQISISINATPENVYKTMLDEESYKQWTSAFNPTSAYKGSWEKGSKIIFTGLDEKGNAGGMVSRIENIPNQFVSIEHIGILHGDKEVTTGPEVEGWAGSIENYTFSKQNNGTLLEIEMDANPEFKAYFEQTWPQALDKLKQLCEA